MEGKPENVSSFEWDPDYNDFTNRFEEWIELRDLKLNTSLDLHDALHDWLGITKSGKSLPTQKQMDFFSEFYNTTYFGISALERESREIVKEEVTYKYRGDSFYNEFTKTFAKRNKSGVYEHYIAAERTFNYRYGDRTILVDVKTNKILAHHFDAKSNKYLGSQY